MQGWVPSVIMWPGNKNPRPQRAGGWWWGEIQSRVVGGKTDRRSPHLLPSARVKLVVTCLPLHALHLSPSLPRLCSLVLDLEVEECPLNQSLKKDCSRCSGCQLLGRSGVSGWEQKHKGTLSFLQGPAFPGSHHPAPIPTGPSRSSRPPSPAWPWPSSGRTLAAPGKGRTAQG